ncbi:MAG: PAS domain S-box protein, partial [Candidatus Lokiarchaeota archaeon]|nr:PAS domain S-box protein [Candidatus Lokiarchaeota archaeon]MBD3199453.1 PAS domain S-box protein [Candidatus Lokiarchaeota archaeon]
MNDLISRISEEEKYILEKLDELICIIISKPPFTIKYINEKVFYQKLKYKRHDLIGKSFLNLLDNISLSKFRLLLNEDILIKPSTNEIQLKSKNNDLIWFEVKLQRFRKEGGLLSYLLSLKDISKLKTLQLKFEEREKKVQNLTKSIPEIRFWKLFTPKKYEEALQNSYEMLQMVINNIPQFIFWKDDKHTYLGSNQSYAEFVGFENNIALVGKKDEDLFNLKEEKLEELRIKEEEVLNYGNPQYHQIEYWKSEHQDIIVYDTNRIPLKDSQNKIVGILVTYEDITEKKKYENLITELNLNFLKFSTNIRKNINLLLKTCKQLLNADIVLYARNNADQNENYVEILSSEDKAIKIQENKFKDEYFLSKFLKKNDDFIYNFSNIDDSKFKKTDPYIRKDKLKIAYGRLIFADDNSKDIICSFFSKNNEKTEQDQLVLLLISDAIEIEKKRWEVNKHLKKQNIKLNQINHLKTELFSRVSHELKTPLISIKGYTELLSVLYQSEMNQEKLSIIERIDKGCSRLERIINKLLEGSRLEQGKLVLDIEKGLISPLIKRSIDELKGLIKARNHHITLDIKDDLEFFFDPDKISDVLENLLSNSIKYTPSGGDIKVSTYLQKDEFIIKIKDNG